MARRKARPAAGTHTVTDLAQLRALADPLRLRILGVLREKPHTTKQVAGVLGEKPTRLYHHVEALEEAGLIELTETRPNRGTVERYYRAVGTRFHVPDGLLCDKPAQAKAVSAAVAILDAARDDILAAPRPRGTPEAFLMRAVFSATPEQVEAIQTELLAVLERIEKEKPGTRPEGECPTFAVTLVMCPTAASG